MDRARTQLICLAAVAACCSLQPRLASAGLFMRGRYTGIVVFDRWDACYLYAGTSVVYVSEKIKSNLRTYAGQSVALNVTQVYQPNNPGDGRIDACEVLGGVFEGEAGVHTAGLKMTAEPVFGEGKAQFRMRIANVGHEFATVRGSHIAPTVLTRNPGRHYGPSDGPSCALVTRYNLGCSTHMWGISEGMKWTLRIMTDGPPPGETVLMPGRSMVVPLVLKLPSGEYQFLCGYGEGGLASNLVSFDVDEAGKPHRVKP